MVYLIRIKVDQAVEEQLVVLRGQAGQRHQISASE